MWRLIETMLISVFGSSPSTSQSMDTLRNFATLQISSVLGRMFFDFHVAIVDDGISICVQNCLRLIPFFSRNYLILAMLFVTL